MSKIVTQITDATVKISLGATEPADWDAVGVTDVSCQITSAAVVANPVTQTVPATFCQGETEVVGKSRWQMDLEGLQDVVEATGVSMFLYDNETREAWVQVVGPTADPGDKTVTIEAPVRLQAGNLLGAAGTPLTFSVSLPCQAKPTVTHGVAA